MKVLEATIEVTETTRLHSWHLEHVAHSERWLPTMLSVIAGMVDLIGFLSLGIFTAHITGNIVVIGALVVRHNRVNPNRSWLFPFLSLPSLVLGYSPEHQEEVAPVYCGYFSWFSFCCSLAC